MTVPLVNLNSYSRLIQFGLLERFKLIAPFNIPGTTYRLNHGRTIQPEHLPYLAVYFIRDSFSADGDANHAEPRFDVDVTLGFSYIVVNNDTDAAENYLDAAHWSVMTLLHDPKWHIFPNGVRIEAVTGGSHFRQYGNLGSNTNETPIAEMRMEMVYMYRIYFEPIINDLFELMHVVAQPEPIDLNQRQSIIAEWKIDQSIGATLDSYEARDICEIQAIP